MKKAGKILAILLPWLAAFFFFILVDSHAQSFWLFLGHALWFHFVMIPLAPWMSLSLTFDGTLVTVAVQVLLVIAGAAFPLSVWSLAVLWKRMWFWLAGFGHAVLVSFDALLAFYLLQEFAW